MFGDKLMVGTKTFKIDAKNRLAMPAFTCACPNDLLVLDLQRNDQEIFLRFSLYEDYMNLAHVLSEKRKEASSIEEFEKLSQEIEAICQKLACFGNLDSQRRFTIPGNILNEAELTSGDEVLIKGAGTSVLVRKIK